MAEGTDWTKLWGGGGSSSGSSGSGTSTSGGTDWTKMFGGPAKKPGGGGGLLSDVGGAIGDVAGAIKGVGVGVGGTIADIGKSFYVIPDESISRGHIPFTNYKPGQEAKINADLQKRLPYLYGAAKGEAQTIREAGGKSALSPELQQQTVSLSQAYSQNPFSAALNDISNIALIAGPAAGAASAATEGAEAGSAAARVGQVARAANTAVNPISWPFRGGRAALAGVGERALAEGATELGPLQKMGVKLTPAYEEAKNVVLEGKAQDNAVRGIVRPLTTDPAAASDALRQQGFDKAAATLDTAAAKAAKFDKPLDPEAVAVGAVRAETAAKLAKTSAAVVAPEDTTGLTSIRSATQGTLAREDTFLPKGLADQIKPYFTAPNQVSGSGLLSGLDVPNRVGYLGKLGISPAPLVGRAGGHTAIVLGSNNPAGVFKNIGRFITGRVKPEELADMPQRVGKAASLPAEAAQQAADTAGRSGINAKVTNAIAKISNKSPVMKIASKMDDVIRKAAYLTEKQGGASADEAARSVLRAFGEFDALRPVERDVLRRLVPFYNWHKQIALITAHMAEDNPMRAQLMLHLGQSANEHNAASGIPEGEIQVGDHLLDPGFLVPFGEAGTTLKGGGSPLLGALPRVAFGLATGNNPTTGKPYSGPLAKAGVDYRHAGVLQGLRKFLPQVNLADALTGRSDVVRYNDGSPVLIKGQPVPTEGNWVDALVSFAGLRSENAKTGTERQKAIDAAKLRDVKIQSKQNSRYQEALKAAGL